MRRGGNGAGALTRRPTAHRPDSNGVLYAKPLQPADPYLRQVVRVHCLNGVCKQKCSDAFFLNQPGEMLERAVIGSFGIIWETASGQLTHIEVIAEAFTTDPLTRARVVTAVAAFHVLVFAALHIPNLLVDRFVL